MAKRTDDIESQLRRVILEGKMTCYRLSKLSGVSSGVLSNFVNEHRSLTLTTAAKLAKVLGLELKPTKPAKKGR